MKNNIEHARTRTRLMKWTYRYIFLLFLLISISVSGRVQAAQADKPAYTLSQAKAYRDEVIPIIERVTGRKFKKIPDIKLVDPETLMREDIVSYSRQYAFLFPGLSKAALKDCATQSAYEFDHYVSGFCEPGKETVNLLPANLPRRLKLAGIDEKYTQDMAKLVIAHELTHCLQDQEFPEALQRKNANTNEKIGSLSALIEGHADFVMSQVAHELGQDEQMAKMTDSLCKRDSDRLDPLVASSFDQQMQELKDRYQAGCKFCAWQNEHGGVEQVWKTILYPPASTNMIYHPETYSSTAPKNDDCKALAAFKTRLGKQGWQVMAGEIGEIRLRSTYHELDQISRDQLIARVDQCEGMVACRGKALMCVTIYIMKDKSSSELLTTQMKKLLYEDAVGMAGSRYAKADPPVIADFPYKQADSAQKCTLLKTICGHQSKTTTVLISKDNIVMSISFREVKRSDTEIAGMADEVLRKLKPQAPAVSAQK